MNTNPSVDASSNICSQQVNGVNSSHMSSHHFAMMRQLQPNTSPSQKMMSEKNDGIGKAKKKHPLIMAPITQPSPSENTVKNQSGMKLLKKILMPFYLESSIVR